MMHPTFIFLNGVCCELFVQFGKRAVYWIDPSASLPHYGILLAGDLVFLVLFVMMLSQIQFERRHWVAIGLFVCTLLYTILISGPAATILAVRNTYLWILFTILFCISAKQVIERNSTRSFVGVTRVLSFFFLIVATIQIQSDFFFEKPWFEYSGTSLNYDGVTNFGQAAKAFSLFSGPTDFAVFGLFAFCIGISSRALGLVSLGAAILVLSGTRGILLAVPLWFAITWLSASHVRSGYLLAIAIFFTLAFFFSEELVSILYSMPNARFSLATLAPRIELWMKLDLADLVVGGGFAANLALENLADAPNVIDSGLIYFLSEMGVVMTVGLIYLLLTAAQRDLLGSRRGSLQLFIGVLLVASIAQIPLHTRLSNFFICLLIYSGLYHAKDFQIRRSMRRGEIEYARSNASIVHAN